MLSNIPELSIQFRHENIVVSLLIIALIVSCSLEETMSFRKWLFTAVIFAVVALVGIDYVRVRG